MDWLARAPLPSFALSEHDFTFRWLQALFESEPLRIAFGMFSGTLFVLATALVSWAVLSGIVASAHEGKALGSRYHAIWAPLRIFLGIALLMPNPIAGPYQFLGAGQIAIYHLAQMSSSMATEVWSAFADSVLVDGYAIVPTSGGGILVRDVALAETCHASRAASGASLGKVPEEAPPVLGVEDARGIVWSYGEACGSILLEEVEGQAEFNAARREAASQVVSSLRQVTGQVVEAVHPTGDGLGLDMAPEKVAGLVTWLHELAGTYNRAVGTAAAAATATRQADERARVSAYMRQHGWTTAGMAWTSISQAAALAADLGSRQHVRILDAENLLALPETQQIVDLVSRVMQLGEREIPIRPSDLTAVADADSDLLTQAMAPYRDALDWVGTNAGTDPDPIASLTTHGHRLLLAGQASILVQMGLAAAAENLVSSAAGLHGAWRTAESYTQWVTMASIAGGFVLAYVIPLLPMIFMVIVSLSWLTAVAEAMIALPVYFLLWARLDGQHDLVDRVQTPGMTMIFSVLLRPVLAVLALSISYIIIPEILRYLDATLATAALGGQGGHIVGVLGTLGLVAVILYLAWKIVVDALHLVVEMPTRIGAWFGSPDRGHGEGQHSTAIIGGLGQGAQRMPSGDVSRRPSQADGQGPGGAGGAGGRAPRGYLGGARRPR